MSESIKQIEYLALISKGLKTNKISYNEISFEEIYRCIEKAYSGKANIDLFFKIYMNLLEKGLEHQDKEEIANVLSLLAHHYALLLQGKNRIDNLMEERFKIKSRYMHHINQKRIEIWYLQHSREEKIPFTGKGVIYTAITGNYDNVKEPKYINSEYDYILFTNNPAITSEVWDVRYVDNKEQLDNVRLARRIKILGHEYLPEYDFSIWVDAKLEIVGDMDVYKNKYRGKESMLCFNHYDNDCIYQEKKACLSLKKDEPEVMEQQMEKYRREGYPEHNGLIDSGFLVRDLHDENVKKVMETWWAEVVTGSKRDQLSFNYACWKNDFVYDTSELFIYGNEYVRLHNHR